MGAVVLIYPALAFWFHVESTTTGMDGEMPCPNCVTVQGD